jgi:hypothetical protein
MRGRGLSDGAGVNCRRELGCRLVLRLGCAVLKVLRMMVRVSEKGVQ